MKNSQEGRKMGKTRMIQFYNDKWDRLQIQLKKKKAFAPKKDGWERFLDIT